MNSAVKFLIGCGGIYGSFIGYGLYQEKIFKESYAHKDDPNDQAKFNYPFSVLLFQLFLASIIGFIMKGKPDPKSIPQPFYIQAKQGFFNCVSMLGSNTALQYVSYPIQALFKSCKVLSVLLVGLLFGQFKYRPLQYVSGTVVTIGIVGFNLSQGKTGGETSLVGIGILVLSLFSDGLLADTQSVVRQKYKPNSFELMYITSKFAVIISFIYGVLTGQLILFLDFVAHRPTIVPDLFVLCTLGAIGQIFIFYTINNFGPNVLAIITTTRKLFTVLASILYYGHHIETIQWICIISVFAGVAIEFYDGHQKRKTHIKSK